VSDRLPSAQTIVPPYAPALPVPKKTETKTALGSSPIRQIPQLDAGVAESQGTSRKSQLLEQTARTQLTSPPPPDLGRVPASIPSTGELQRRQRKTAIAPLKIITEAGTNYLVRLVSTRSAKDHVVIYVKGGETYSTKVPLGSYTFRAASGDIWYGREHLFGSNTVFFRLRGKKGETQQDTHILRFTRSGNSINGLTISMQKTISGNLEQEHISRAEFNSQDN
jgi:hypothetical protein